MTEHVKAEWYDNEHKLSDGSYVDKNGNVCYIKNGMFHREDGPAIIQLNGTSIWCLDGKKHREGRGPAVESVSGYKAWYKNGVLHRNDGPAITDSDGTEEWWVDGVKTTKNETISNKIIKNETISNNVKHVKAEWYSNERNLPDGSYIDKHGDVCYVKNGRIHRDDGPAIVRDNGNKFWYKNGKQHREDGPAEEYTNGDRWWWVDGKRHREDGPAIEWANGKKEWYINNERYWTKEDYDKKIKEIKPQTKTGSEKQVIKHKKAEWYGNEHNLPDGSYINKHGNVCYIKNGEWHREDGPAIEWSSGNKSWWVNGKRHREDGPAVEYSDGERSWYINNERCGNKEDYDKKIKEIKHKKAEWYGNEHNLPDWSYIDSRGSVCYIKNGEWNREGGPAVERDDGSKWWYRNGKRHREDGPAEEWADGGKLWYLNGKRHREDGPAVEWSNGDKEWYINDKQCKTKEEYEEALKVWKINEIMK